MLELSKNGYVFNYDFPDDLKAILFGEGVDVELLTFSKETAEERGYYLLYRTTSLLNFVRKNLDSIPIDDLRKHADYQLVQSVNVITEMSQGQAQQFNCMPLVHFDNQQEPIVSSDIPMLSEAIKDYIKFKYLKGDWKGPRKHEFERVFELFLGIAGDRCIFWPIMNPHSRRFSTEP